VSVARRSFVALVRFAVPRPDAGSDSAARARRGWRDCSRGATLNGAIVTRAVRGPARGGPGPAGGRLWRRGPVFSRPRSGIVV